MFPTLLAQSVQQIPQPLQGSSFVEWLLGSMVLAIVAGVGYLLRFWLPSLITNFREESKEQREVFGKQIENERAIWREELVATRKSHKENIDAVCAEFRAAAAQFSRSDSEHTLAIRELQEQLKERQERS